MFIDHLVSYTYIYLETQPVTTDVHWPPGQLYISIPRNTTCDSWCSLTSQHHTCKLHTYLERQPVAADARWPVAHHCPAWLQTAPWSVDLFSDWRGLQHQGQRWVGGVTQGQCPLSQMSHLHCIVCTANLITSFVETPTLSLLVILQHAG